MTQDDFRRLALSLPGAVEAAHMGHPDFRINGKIFATLGWPDATWGMVKLAPEEQSILVEAAPTVFAPVPGGWGRRGSTRVCLAAADEAPLRQALSMAWRRAAPKSLVARLDRARQPEPAAGEPSEDSAAISRLRAAVAALGRPQVEEGTSYGTFALKLRGKMLVRVKDEDTLVFRCPLDEKEMLIEAAPEIYFETDHYKGWPAVLVRLSKADDAELQHRLRRAWRAQAPAKLLAQVDGKPAGAAKGARV